MQAFVTAIWRATQWIKKHSPDEIQDAIEPYVGSTSRAANIIEITAMQRSWIVTPPSNSAAPGEKAWFTVNDRHHAADAGRFDEARAQTKIRRRQGLDAGHFPEPDLSPRAHAAASIVAS